MSWAPGTIVICVDDGPLRPCNLPSPLSAGHHYTVRKEVTSRLGAAVVLFEIANQHDATTGFCRRRFRLAEGGQCESTRAQAIKQERVTL